MDVDVHLSNADHNALATAMVVAVANRCACATTINVVISATVAAIPLVVAVADTVADSIPREVATVKAEATPLAIVVADTAVTTIRTITTTTDPLVDTAKVRVISLANMPETTEPADPPTYMGTWAKTDSPQPVHIPVELTLNSTPLRLQACGVSLRMGEPDGCAVGPFLFNMVNSMHGGFYPKGGGLAEFYTTERAFGMRARDGACDLRARR